MQEDITDIHHLFKDFVKDHRPHLDIEKVATGEHWFGIRAKELGLVDELNTSDDYLLNASKANNLLQITFPVKKKFGGKLAEAAHTMFNKFLSIEKETHYL